MKREDVIAYAKAHTVKECAEYFNKSYSCMQRYLALYKIKHLARNYYGENNGRYLHGMSGTRLNNIYVNMKQRCYNSRSPNYKIYGGRGITVCDAWKSSKQSFFDWALSSGYTDVLTLDRIDVNGGYCPENCRWVDRKAQANNTRYNDNITYRGVTKTLTQWAEEYNLPPKILRARVHKYNIPFERAITYHKGMIYTYKGETHNLKEIAKAENIKYSTLSSRVHKLKMSLEEALAVKTDMRRKR